MYWLSGIAASRRVETIGVVEVDRNGIRHRSFIDDPALPGLREAIDGERVRVRLGGTSSCRVTPVRHKPGVSCVLRYTIADNDTELFAKAFARVTFTSDNRTDLPKVSVPTLILQCKEDIIASTVVGEFVHRQIPASNMVVLDATGHCPNLSAPREVVSAIQAFV